jgi:hypothetical protein
MREGSDALHRRCFCLIAIAARVPDESTVGKRTRRLGAETVAGAFSAGDRQGAAGEALPGAGGADRCDGGGGRRARPDRCRAGGRGGADARARGQAAGGEGGRHGGAGRRPLARARQAAAGDRAHAAAADGRGAGAGAGAERPDQEAACRLAEGGGRWCWPGARDGAGAGPLAGGEGGGGRRRGSSPAPSGWRS